MAASTWRTIDDALVGFDATDVALWMFSPFNATLRMIQQRQEEAERAERERRVPTDTVRDITQTAAYQAGVARGQEADRRGAAADTARVQALQALHAIRSAPVQSAAPIPVNVPSFALGGRR